LVRLVKTVSKGKPDQVQRNMYCSSHFPLSALKSIRHAVKTGMVPEKARLNSRHHNARVLLVCLLWGAEERG
jgi:hypothetical protein